MNKNIINTQQFRTIYEAACETWKFDLVKWYSGAVAIHGKVEISQSVVDGMFAEATPSQNDLLVTIFGSREVDFKVGDWVTLKGTNTPFNDGTRTKQAFGF